MKPLYLVVPLVLLALLASNRLHHPNDQAMLTHHQRHSAQFDALVRMLSADPQILSLTQEGQATLRPGHPPLSAQRLAEYQRRMAQLAIHRLSAYHEPTSIDFEFSHRGRPRGGSVKGFAYREEIPTALVPQLEAHRAQGSNAFFAHQRIRGAWYLYHFEP
ncbi:hypothetical protein [Ferrimonas balearica]|uniref:hypothetical protein n=1 Tax=Ferrimonas balearica TaxID=44012 RepID=UPI001C9A0A0E|nr:hypothetical protein [Ferrimonas balearica]MBY5993341.1 hypothetical protein [Ferrimonas balearica]